MVAATISSKADAADNMKNSGTLSVQHPRAGRCRFPVFNAQVHQALVSNWCFRSQKLLVIRDCLDQPITDRGHLALCPAHIFTLKTAYGVSVAITLALESLSNLMSNPDWAPFCGFHFSASTTISLVAASRSEGNKTRPILLETRVFPKNGSLQRPNCDFKSVVYNTAGHRPRRVMVPKLSWLQIFPALAATDAAWPAVNIN